MRAGAGIRVHLIPRRPPTPLLAFAVRHLSAAGGIMITASHNPPADNGYKLYLGDGAQIIPPADAEIESAIRGLGPLSRVPLASPDSPLLTWHGDEVAQAYLDAICAVSPAPPGPACGHHDRVVHDAVPRSGGGRRAVRRDAYRVQVDRQGGRVAPRQPVRPGL